MFKVLLIQILLLTTLQKNIAAPPKITGTWEGRMSNEMLQINILEKNNKICGYTYDHFINNKKEYCKALFDARYNREQEVWYLTGTGFLENSGGHVLMRIRLWFEPGEGNNTMHALVSIKSGLLSWMGSAEEVILERVSSSPNNQGSIEAYCFPKEEKKQVEQKKPVVPPVTKTPAPKPEVTRKDSSPQAIIPAIVPPVVKKDSNRNNITTRKKNTFAHLVVDVKTITLTVYDNGIVDGDTVSIYYNGKLLASRQRISEKPLTLQLELDEAAALHEITLFAENLGSIPPNTALVVVTAGGKRYELHSSASLTENAVLFLEYKPK
ncbi:MAG: hypothetical protein ABIY51_11710 [Ferruginibacter sp.]